MILSVEQCNRFFELFNPLIAFANARLGIGARLDDPWSRDYSTEQAKVSDELWRHPEVIDEFVAANPAGLPPAFLQAASSWKGVLSERFSYKVEPDGQVGLLFEDHIFEPFGLSREISTMLGAGYGVADIALLPYEGVIVYASAIREFPISIGPGMRKSYDSWFSEARAAGRVVRTAERFAQVVPVLKEQAIAREAQRLIEDAEYDLNPPTEFPGVHRGVLADLSPEEREEAIRLEVRKAMGLDGQERSSRIEAILRDRCIKGPVCTDFASLASTEKNATLEHFVRDMGARRSSGLNKKQLVRSAADLLASNPAGLATQLIRLSKPEFTALKGLFDRGGRMTVKAREVESLFGLPTPIPLLCYLIDDGDEVAFVIPDEAFEALKIMGIESMVEHFEQVGKACDLLSRLVDTRGILSLDDGLIEYQRIFPGDEMDLKLLQGMALQSVMADDQGFELFFDRCSKTLYAVDWQLLDALEESGASVFDGDGVCFGEMGLLEDLLDARAGKDPWPLPDELLQADGVLEWAMKLPSAQTFAQFLNENVPDGENDFFFADRVMDEVIGCGISGIDATSIVQYLADEGLAFEDLRHENKMIGLLFTLLNDLPRWDNNGWPPSALHAATTGKPDFRNPDGSRMRVGRNDPCPCGSGKKYKKCCGR